jgi:hypothetical protein
MCSSSIAFASVDGDSACHARTDAIGDRATDVVAPVYIGLPLGMLVARHTDRRWRATLLLIGTRSR